MIVFIVSDSYLSVKTKIRKCAGGVTVILAGCGPADPSSIGLFPSTLQKYLFAGQAKPLGKCLGNLGPRSPIFLSWEERKPGVQKKEADSRSKTAKNDLNEECEVR